MFNFSKTRNNPKYAVITLLADSPFKIIYSFQETIFPKSPFKKQKNGLLQLHQLNDGEILGKTKVTVKILF